MIRFLVTGGLGFIGSHFIRYMLDKYPSFHIYNLDLQTYAGNRDNVRSIASLPHYHEVIGDICNPAVVDDLLKEDIDFIVHFAAESHVDRSIADPAQFVRTNVLGTQTLLEAAHKHRIKKFIHISTDEVYGSLGASGLFTEETPLSPNSPYSASKAASDLLALAYCRTYGLPVTVTRCSNNYGPNQFPEKLIPTIITQALQNKRIPIYGDGQNVRDWLYVTDHCAAIDLVAQRGLPGEVYNIGGNNEHSNLEIAERILRLLGKPHNLLEYVPDRLGHDRRYGIDASKIREQLGWRPETGFEQGIAASVAWYRRNERWWRRILSGAYRTGGSERA